jgi:fructokinase
MIICIGESLIDFIPHDADANGLPLYRPVAGGCPYNCSIAAARLGAEVAFAGTVSNDFFGDHLVDSLRSNGVGLSMVTRTDRPTTLAFVKKAADGSARYAFFTNDAADRALETLHVPRPLPDRAILQMGSISIIPDPEGSTILHLAEDERASRVVAFDPNVREDLAPDHDEYRGRIERALRATTLLKTSDEDLAWIYPDTPFDAAVRRVFDLGVRLIVVTRGAAGSEAITSRTRVAVPAERVEVSDTIGAGDSFLAALLVWFDEHGVLSGDAVEALEREALADALGFASRVSAITCTRVGADPPHRGEVAAT